MSSQRNTGNTTLSCFCDRGCGYIGQPAQDRSFPWRDEIINHAVFTSLVNPASNNVFSLDLQRYNHSRAYYHSLRKRVYATRVHDNHPSFHRLNVYKIIQQRHLYRPNLGLTHMTVDILDNHRHQRINDATPPSPCSKASNMIACQPVLLQGCLRLHCRTGQ